MKVLDYGYVELVETWGSEERVIEAARMSTGKGFLGWEKLLRCHLCGYENGALKSEVQALKSGDSCLRYLSSVEKCSGTMTEVHPGDNKLLRFLYEHHHATPFEMAGLVLEVKAPIFVFREWHRHRTQSYNELSARYTPLPGEDYQPTLTRVVDGAIAAGKNRQAAGAAPLAGNEQLQGWLLDLEQHYNLAQILYERGLALGVPKELARLPVPVARYSTMRAAANLRNWLGFLTLRLAPNAQWEIRQYAEAVRHHVGHAFPRTLALFDEERQRG